ncbi:hypothetical protein [Kamptonema formosum]|uniref:hypothetical protein n=1 Tax=Kamptonema formosum TaxID=331992 RepID=UPI00037C37E3|nr:hypothetical protein [Oscillatoria sp. PCC 10802]
MSGRIQMPHRRERRCPNACERALFGKLRSGAGKWAPWARKISLSQGCDRRHRRLKCRRWPLPALREQLFS